MQEIWKEIKGLEGAYEISNKGNFRDATTKEKLSTRNSLGYKRIVLKPFEELIDRNVAIAFIDNPNGYQFIKHIDGDILNNKIGNLKWVDEKPLPKKLYGSGIAYEIGKFDLNNIYIESFKSVSAAGKSLGKSHTAISECVNGNRKIAYGFKWKYLLK